MRAARFPTNPLLAPESDPTVGTNLNGPSVIRVPPWIDDPLGRLYMYFAHHKGTHIRLAYADDVRGPWHVHSPGTLQLAGSTFSDHIASPDVHVDNERREVLMYVHGVVDGPTGNDRDANAIDALGAHVQRTKLAVSQNGIDFTVVNSVLAPSYYRGFVWEGRHFGLAMPGIVYRSDDGRSGFERGPQLFADTMRHSAVIVFGDVLHVFYSEVGDAPERIKHATVELTSDWHTWSASVATTVLEPSTAYEGGRLPIAPSQRGLATHQVRELRDPAILEDDGEVYLFYSIAGEAGIAGATVSGI